MYFVVQKLQKLKKDPGRAREAVYVTWGPVCPALTAALQFSYLKLTSQLLAFLHAPRHAVLGSAPVSFHLVILSYDDCSMVAKDDDDDERQG